MSRKKTFYGKSSSAMEKKFESMLKRELKDHRYSVFFSLNENKRYQDDVEMKAYEVIKESGKEYLVFTLSLVKVALAMDEAEMFKKEIVVIELRTDSLSSFSTSNNVWKSVLGTIMIFVLFIFILSQFVPGVGKYVFGVFNFDYETHKHQ